MTTTSQRRRRVSFVLPSLAGGGAERVAVQVLNALDADKWDRSMYVFERSGPYLGEVSPSIRLDAGSAASRVGRWLALRRYIRTARPDVIVAFLSYLTVLTAVRAAAVGGRVVFAIGKSVLNRTSKTHIGELCLKYGGGGHEAAGTCQIDADKASAVREEETRTVRRMKRS